MQSRYEIWTLRHPLRRMSRGKILRIILAAEATVVWSTDDWSTTNESVMTHQNELNLWFSDSPTADWPANTMLAFTLFWKADERWQGDNWHVKVL